MARAVGFVVGFFVGLAMLWEGSAANPWLPWAGGIFLGLTFAAVSRPRRSDDDGGDATA